MLPIVGTPPGSHDSSSGGGGSGGGGGGGDGGDRKWAARDGWPDSAASPSSGNVLCSAASATVETRRTGWFTVKNGPEWGEMEIANWKIASVCLGTVPGTEESRFQG